MGGKQTDTPPASREQHAAALAASMPDDKAGLLAVALAAVQEQHAAVLAGDDAAASTAAERYEATVWKLNGGGFFGCMGADDAAGKIIERHCRAVPGAVPTWGQRGEFVIQVEGIRALVEFGDGFGMGRTHFAFRAVDLDRPFISETGYRSHFDELIAGHTVDEAATGIFRAYLTESKPKNIAAADRDRLASQALPSWCADLVPKASRMPATVPAGFALVDVVLPAHRAFIVKKWAEQAQKKIEAIQAEKQAECEQERAAAALEKKRRELERQAAEAANLNAGEEVGAGQFRPGQRCEIVSVHHRVFERDIGKRIIITKVHADTRQVWAYDDKPVRYRINRNGRRVVECDPACIQSIYSFDALRILNEGENDHER